MYDLFSLEKHFKDEHKRKVDAFNLYLLNTLKKNHSIVFNALDNSHAEYWVTEGWEYIYSGVDILYYPYCTLNIRLDGKRVTVGIVTSKKDTKLYIVRDNISNLLPLKDEYLTRFIVAKHKGIPYYEF